MIITQIGSMDSSTCVFGLSGANDITRGLDNSVRYYPTQFNIKCPGTYSIEDPLFCSLENFERAKLLYTLDAIKLLELKNRKISLPPFIEQNLMRFEMASNLLIESRDEYRKNLADENRMLGEILEEDFFFEIAPIKSYTVKAKIKKFEIVLPDTSDIEEF
jgi:hypothetical protein